MKATTSKPLTMLAVAAVILTGACKKNEDTPSLPPPSPPPAAPAPVPTYTRADTLVGTWKATEEGEDANRNGVWDANEHSMVDSNALLGSLIFKAGGTGTANIPAIPAGLSLSWALLNNDQDLRIIIALLGSKDTLYTNIVSLTNSELVTKDTTGGVTSFTLAKKQ